MNDATVYAKRWWALAVLCLSLFIISLDNTILNVALPTLQGELDASASQLQWIVDAYVLVFAGLLLTMGSLGDRFGRKRALYAGFAIFAVGSVAAAWAGSAGELIGTRALMGVGAALIMPSTLSILTNIFPEGERAKAIAIWAGTAGLSVPLGPLAGGWLLEHFWWGSIFLINVPIAIAAVVGGYLLIPESRDPRRLPLDPVGAILSMAGLTTLLYGIIEAPSHGWTSATSLACFAGATAILAGFAAWERRREHPMLDVRLFKNRSFSGASAAMALVFFALFGAMFFLTQYMQFVKDYSTLGAGARIVPVAAGILFGTALSAQLVPRFGARLSVGIGLAVVASGLAILSTAGVGSGYGVIALAIVVIGFGMGLTMSPATESIMSAVPKDNAGVGSAVNDTTREIGGALGVAILGSLLSTAYSDNVREATANLPAPAASGVEGSIGAALSVAANLGGPQGAAVASAAKTAFVDGMQVSLLVGAGFALAGALVAWFVLPAGVADVEPEAMPTELSVLDDPLELAA